MTTATMAPSAGQGRRSPGFASTLASEWVKLRSVRATYIQVALAIGLALLLTALFALAIGAAFDDLQPQDQATFDPISVGFLGSGLGAIVLIVMGVQGSGAANLMAFGSTTQHVVRQATCPVLTLRQG